MLPPAIRGSGLLWFSIGLTPNFCEVSDLVAAWEAVERRGEMAACRESSRSTRAIHPKQNTNINRQMIHLR
jgi:hypothetical protein